MKQPKLYILCGLPFAGKTYLAKKIATHIRGKLIAFDQLWLKLVKDPNLPTPVKGDEGWRLTRQAAKIRIVALLKTNQTVVYDDTNVRFEHRDELRNLAEHCGAKPVVVYVDTPEEVRTARMKQNLLEKRRHDVESDNLKTALAQFEPPAQAENVIIYDQSMDLDQWMKQNI